MRYSPAIALWALGFKSSGLTVVTFLSLERPHFSITQIRATAAIAVLAGAIEAATWHELAKNPSRSVEGRAQYSHCPIWYSHCASSTTARTSKYCKVPDQERVS